MYKNWYKSQKKSFQKYNAGADKNSRWTQIQNRARVVRLLCYTQVDRLSASNKQHKELLMEIQVNGGSIADKVEFCKKLMEKPIRVSTVFANNDMCDTIAVTKGRGTEGVVTRWGVTRLPRKTHRGSLRSLVLELGIHREFRTPLLV